MLATEYTFHLSFIGVPDPDPSPDKKDKVVPRTPQSLVALVVVKAGTQSQSHHKVVSIFVFGEIT